jgi:putative GTP pyrophosphokinase
VAKLDAWIDDALPRYELLGKHISFIIENLLQSNGIDYLSVTYRTKTKSGIEEKVKRKSYSKPEIQLTDISGVRVILYFETDLPKACEIIKSTFNIDLENSIDNDKRLSTDKIGYRSVHYVCDIGEQRKDLAEYVFISNLKCEIQVRTMLQHAWSELTHDRNYKIGSHLPSDIQRKINLYSGMLELADQGFSEIIESISQHREKLKIKPLENLYDLTIDSLSLNEFFEKVTVEYNIPTSKLKDFEDSYYNELLNEIKFMGITGIGELKALIPHNYSEVLNSFNEEATIFGFIRDLLLIKDFRKLHKTPGLNWCVQQLSDNGVDDVTVDYYSNFMDRDEADELFHIFNET